MKVSAAEFASDSQAVLDRVIDNGETVEVQRHGQTVAEIRPKVGVSRDELIRILQQIRFTPEEQEELKAAMKEANNVFGYAGRD